MEPLKTCRCASDCSGVPQTIQVCIRLFKCARRLCRFIQDCAGVYETVRVCIRSCRCGVYISEVCIRMWMFVVDCTGVWETRQVSFTGVYIQEGKCVCNRLDKGVAGCSELYKNVQISV